MKELTEDQEEAQWIWSVLRGSVDPHAAFNHQAYDENHLRELQKRLVELEEKVPPHTPTFRAARDGWPTKKYAMKPEGAMRMARRAMRSALLREYQ